MRESTQINPEVTLRARRRTLRGMLVTAIAGSLAVVLSGAPGEKAKQVYAPLASPTKLRIREFLRKGAGWEGEWPGSFSLNPDGTVSASSGDASCTNAGSYVVGAKSISWRCGLPLGGARKELGGTLEVELVSPGVLVYRDNGKRRVVSACEPGAGPLRCVRGSQLVQVVPGAADHALFERVKGALASLDLPAAALVEGAQATRPRVQSQLYYSTSGDEPAAKALATSLAKSLEPLLGAVEVQPWPGAWDHDVVVVVGSEAAGGASAWRVDLSMAAPGKRQGLARELENGGYTVDVDGAGRATLGGVDVPGLLTTLLTQRLVSPDEWIDGSGSKLKNSYFVNVVLCLPVSLPSWNRHEGYYRRHEKGCTGKRSRLVALLVHNMDRRPEVLQALWAAHRPRIFELVNRQTYAASDMKKTVEALLATWDGLAKLTDGPKQLAAAHRGILAMHADPKNYDDVYGWGDWDGWAAKIPEPLIIKTPEPVNDAWQTSFWMRRTVEGNAAVVHDMLVEIAAHYR